MIGETDPELVEWLARPEAASRLLRGVDFETAGNQLAVGGRLVDIRTPTTIYPAVYVQQMDEMRTGRNRIHIDVGVPHDQAEARVAAALAAGGTLVNDSYAPMWWTLADPEGNEFDIYVSDG